MNVLLDIGLCLLLLGVCLATPVAREDVVKEKRAAATAIVVGTAVLNGLSSLLAGINGPNNVKDTIVYNRAIRITVNGACATVTDRDSGYKSTKCGNGTGIDAASAATEELFTLLIKIGLFSTDDLHHRPPPPTRPAKICKDTITSVKCARHIREGHCDIGNHYFHWMHENCFKSCAGCNSLDDIFNASKQASLAGF